MAHCLVEGGGVTRATVKQLWKSRSEFQNACEFQTRTFEISLPVARGTRVQYDIIYVDASNTDYDADTELVTFLDMIMTTSHDG